MSEQLGNNGLTACRDSNGQGIGDLPYSQFSSNKIEQITQLEHSNCEKNNNNSH